MPLVPCPVCHSMQRGAAMRCWHCGFDFAHPDEVPANAPEPLPQAPLEPEAPEEVGPCPTGLWARLLDPRLSSEELARSVRGYELLPFRESYYRMGALLVGEAITHGLAWPRAWVEYDPFRASAFMGGTYFAYRGGPGPLLVGMALWTIGLLVAAATLAGSARWPHAWAFAPLVALYVVLVVLSKAVRVAFARRDYVRRMSAGHMGEL